MKMVKYILNILVVILSVSIATFVAGAEEFSRPTVFVNPKVTVKGEKILLGDIAKISISHSQFETVAARLALVDLGNAPSPLSSTTLVGSNILTAIEKAGIAQDQIGYSIPKTVVVERSGREISKDEILNALRDKFSRSDVLDIQVKDVTWNNNQVIPSGDTSYEIYRLGEPSGGKIPIRIEALVDQMPAARFLATAIADDWREIPVLRRTIDRGMLISSDDIQMVRLNLFQQPEDIIFKPENVVGYRAKGRLVAGDVIRSNEVDVPPMIPRGAQVTMVYRKGALVASAKGQTLADGFENGEVMVRNTKSQRVLKAKVKNAEQVEVIAE